MRRPLITTAASLALLATPALAQTERAPVSSGVVPAEVANTAERPIRFAATAPAGGVLAIPMAGAADTVRVPAAIAAAVQSAVASAKFEAGANATLDLYGVGGYDRVMLVGVPTGSLSAVQLADLGGSVAQATATSATPVAILTAGLQSAVATPAAHVARGVGLGQYRFDRLKTVDRTTANAQPIVIVAGDDAAQAYARDHAGLVDGVRMTRDLITMPSNLKYPESFVAIARAMFEGVPNTRITVLDEPQMRRLNMGSILSVSQGSSRPARMMIVEYRGGGDAAPLALIGKGITFDSGGISLKPGAGMEDMRGDMSGAAAVIGGVLAAAKRGARANVVAIAALAENMPGANASRPGDVVRTMNGRTIEIISTDAEGRMVLADANQYAIDRYKPAAVVNIATLTGAIVTALGDDYAGLFARDEALADRIEAAAASSGDPVWRMPLHPSYAEDMASPIADIANAVRIPGAGAGRGAHFIGFLTPEPTPWAHIDMAGMDSSSGTPTAPKGAPGFGVRLFDDLIRSYER
ncbi:leucyl aminopeptidase family protein [Sphingomonas baiyangensis]|uniref:Probable cytosol aminopeptidase n=1 Tax=Sphingomonas baiyangensis TaxID=2572576 RepID=A0A4U1L3H9_9SPHN|nr:leucyl aminopeptidase [Sphingomonas baiyangensis]TKD50780.1 leucyl aminopeptidase [Sphingomonas baiyangensis]